MGSMLTGLDVELEPANPLPAKADVESRLLLIPPTNTPEQTGVIALLDPRRQAAWAVLVIVALVLMGSGRAPMEEECLNCTEYTSCKHNFNTL